MHGFKLVSRAARLVSNHVTLQFIQSPLNKLILSIDVQEVVLGIPLLNLYNACMVITTVRNVAGKL